MAKTAIKIGDSYFYDYTLYGKTLYANKDIQLYFSPSLRIKTNLVKKGQPIGIFQAYSPADKSKKWYYPTIAVGPNTRNLQTIKYEPDAISATAFKQQGATDVNKEVIIQKEKDTPWYVKIANKILPYAALTAIAIAYFKKNK